jgi:hypothetical protein
MKPTSETQSTSETQPANEKKPKKPYQPPKFTVYGNLVEMTKTNPTGMGQKDNIVGVLKT